jgi:hypothetical protein
MKHFVIVRIIYTLHAGMGILSQDGSGAYSPEQPGTHKLKFYVRGLRKDHRHLSS